jgi:hypothetical protein
MPDKWAQYAQPASGDKWEKYAQPATPAPGDADYAPPIKQSAPTLSKVFNPGPALNSVGDVLQGVGAGALSTANNIGKLVYPDALAKHLTGVPTPEAEDKLFGAHNTTQKIAKGAEQAGEFIIPGPAEESGAAKLASLAPRLGKVALPLAKVATSALSAGGVNAAQGGSPVTGAAMGAGGQVLGQGIKAAAPIIAETALGLPKAARAFGKTPGTALLEETRGIRPSTIAASAQDRLGELTPQLEHAADAASVKPNPAKAMLPAPAQRIPLPGAENFIRDSPGELIPAAPFPRGNIVGGSSPRVASELGSTEATIPPRLTRDDLFMHSGVRPPSELPTSGPGILIRPFEAPVGGGIPPLPNTSASLAPARSILSDATAKAGSQNAEGLHRQLGNMQDFLARRFQTGEAIPEDVTPRDLLDLKRGFNEEHLRWNPEMHDRALSTGRQAYNALDQELDRTVPQAADLNQRISSLIPVAQRAESVSRNAPTLQRAAQRFGAHTGALTLGGVGGYQGYREGGVPGAIAGGLTGVLAPELIASPEGQMALARTLYKANGLRTLVGSALQLTRPKEGQ